MGKLRPGWRLCDLGRQAHAPRPRPALTDMLSDEHPQRHCQPESESPVGVFSSVPTARLLERGLTLSRPGP